MRRVRLVKNDNDDTIVSLTGLLKDELSLYGFYDGGGPDEPMDRYLIVLLDNETSTPEAIGLTPNGQGILEAVHIKLDDNMELLRFKDSLKAIKWLLTGQEK